MELSNPGFLFSLLEDLSIDVALAIEYCIYGAVYPSNDKDFSLLNIITLFLPI